MKHNALLFSILILVSSCALPRFSTSPVPKATPVRNETQTSSDKPSAPSKPSKSDKTRAIFHVIEPLGFDLVLFNIERSIEKRVRVDKTLSQVKLKSGHWQVRGFVLNKIRYDILNPSSQFIFTLRSKKITYVGSYIVKCPKVGDEFLPDIKKMSFFNRYPFRSKKGLCEIIVGSDYENVNRVWVEVGNGENAPLALGF